MCVGIAAKCKQISISDCGFDTAAAQASVPLLWGACSELPVLCDGGGTVCPLACVGEQDTPAKDCAFSLRCHAGRVACAIFVGVVAGA